MKIVPLLLLAMSGSLCAADFQAGLARTNITPPLPFYLSGYAARTRPAAVVRSQLWAKALALQDQRGNRVVFVTMDLIGLPREMSDAVAERVREKFGLSRSQLLLNASHTHCGPAVWPNLRVLFDFDAAEQQRVSQYAARLTDDLTALVGAALADLSPAALRCGHGAADFAVNRRQPIPDGLLSRESLKGPVDHDVPVLRVAAPDGRLRAVLFGYACHNTTLRDVLEVDGDYAGAAQRALEQAHPGATALFMMLCGGDQNPHPRGTAALAEEHGQSLAAAVDKVLAAPLRTVHGPIRTTYTTTALDFAPHTRAMFEQEAKETHVFKQRRAKLLLAAYDRGEPPRQLTYPVQAVRFGKDLAFLALGGEVVVDYALRARREFPGENLVVAGYCNDVMCYLPSRRVLREGGYEAVDSMIYYGRPGPFAENVEETVFRAVHQVMEQVGVKTVGEKSKPAQP
jgi:neutral ceramidase